VSSKVNLGYKETAIGLIPQEWECLTLGELLRSPPEYGANASAEDYKEGDIRYLRITDITEDSKLKLFGKKSLPRDVGEKYLLSDGDILLARSGSVGRSFVYRSVHGAAAFAGYLLRFRIGHRASVEYVSQYFQSDAYWSWVASAAKIGAQPNINAEQYKTLRLPVPLFQEQQKIATILSAIDDKLDLTVRQIAATRTLKQGLMQTLFTRGVGTQDATGRWVPHAEFKESSLGDIPASWWVTEIHSIASVIRGASPRPQGDPRYYGGAVPRLMGADVTRDGKWVTPRIDFLTEEGAKLSRPCPKGTLTIICSGDVGIPAFLAVDACIHDGFLALIDINESLVNKDFLYHIIFSLKQRLDASATHGGVFTNLTTGILKEFAIPLPPLAEQDRIATILSSIDEKLDALASRKAHCKTLKRGLMQKLLTGEWRVQLSP
jgi:type I restriction enzyme, S subunit